MWSSGSGSGSDKDVWVGDGWEFGVFFIFFIFFQTRKVKEELDLVIYKQ
jgi:hypothetical protein